jgi:hypothetical protein
MSGLSHDALMCGGGYDHEGARKRILAALPALSADQREVIHADLWPGAESIDDALCNATEAELKHALSRTPASGEGR